MNILIGLAAYAALAVTLLWGWHRLVCHCKKGGW